MATKDVTPCVGSTSEDIVEEEEEFKNKSWRTDVTLKVEDRLFYVSKHVLGTVSPVFEAMFDGENKDEDLSEIPLPDKKSRDVLEFLRCIYPNVLKPVTESNVLSVLPLAVEYQVTKLTKTCESFLLKRVDETISTKNLCILMRNAHAYNLQILFNICEQTAITRPRVDFEKYCNEVSMPGVVKRQIMTKMFISIETKYKQLLKENITARTLCKVICHVEKKQPLVERFLQGELTGKSFSFAIDSPYDQSFDINIDKDIFTIRFERNQLKYGNRKQDNIRAFIRRCNQVDGSLSYDWVVFLKNWMTGKSDLVNTRSQYDLSFFRKLQSKEEYTIFDALTSEVVDETKGYIYKGVCNFEIYLFIGH